MWWDCGLELGQIAAGAIWRLRRSGLGAHPAPAERTIGGHFKHGRNAHGDDITGYTPQQQQLLIQEIASQVNAGGAGAFPGITVRQERGSAGGIVQRDISIPLDATILNTAAVTVNATLSAAGAAPLSNPTLKTGRAPSYLRLYMAPHGAVTGGTLINTVFLS
jgi:hypothetical protein